MGENKYSNADCIERTFKEQRLQLVCICIFPLVYPFFSAAHINWTTGPIVDVAAKRTQPVSFIIPDFF